MMKGWTGQDQVTKKQEAISRKKNGLDGLKDEYRKTILDILTANPRVERIVLFGSRAMGTFTPESDIDLALYGDELTLTDLAELKEKLEETTIPQKVDLLLAKDIEKKDLLEHIRKHGVEWWRRGKGTQWAQAMRSEWIETTVGEFCPFVYGKNLPEKKRKKGPYLVYGSNGPVGFHNKSLVEGPGIIIGRKGTVGAVHYAAQPFWPIDTTFYVTEAEHRDLRYTYYLLKSLGLEYMNTDSAVPGLNRDAAHLRKILVPALPEQRAIAHILGTLDDKIELNRQMNETLEKMARAIFKSWFVDFDPVVWKAVKAGNPVPEPFLKKAAYYKKGSPCPVPEEIATLFPDSFEESELGPIPRRWGVKEIRECCSKIQNGGTPKRSESDYWNPGTIPWLTSGEVRQPLITATENMISELGLKNSSAKWLPEGSTVVALYGATAGQVAFISSKMTTNQAVCGLIPKTNLRYFNYLFLNRSEGALANLARGSAQQNISKGIVEKTKLIIPREELLESFDQIVSPLFDKWVENLEESNTLSNLRDTLLPKLISGELSVPDAEKLVEAAI